MRWRRSGWLAGSILAGVAMLPAPAAAAPPSNDDFLDAQTLGPGLPVEVTATNREATKEVGEPGPGDLDFANTGHSIWFAWEATGNGFVTVGTCGSSISTALGVYTGTTIGTLSEIAGDFASEGPDCATPRGNAVTFRATAGVKYTIFVDGRASFPEEGALVGQGTVELGIDATPAPPNDDFADATVLNGQILEGGAYAAGASGFNWNATREPGEPQHAGGPGGASVWYSWTAPSSGSYGLMSCGRFDAWLGVYTGDSLGSLAEVLSRQGCGISILAARLGTTYRIAIDGAFDAGSAAAVAGSFSLNVFQSPPESGSGFRDRAKKVSTWIVRKVVKSARRQVTFAFRSDPPGVRFLCRLDQRPLRACRSPRTYRNLDVGRHTFMVTAVDSTGNAGSSPLARFRIAGARPR